MSKSDTHPITVTDLEKAIAKKYERMIGRPTIGLLDTLRILSSPDLIELMQLYLEAKGEQK